MSLFSYSDFQQFAKGRMDAMRKYFEAFDELPDVEGLHVSIEFQGITFHLCTPDFYPDEEMRKQKKKGYMIGKEVWIWTKYVDGEYIINEYALGHEMVHMLQQNFNLISDPDKWEARANE